MLSLFEYPLGAKHTVTGSYMQWKKTNIVHSQALNCINNLQSKLRMSGNLLQGICLSCCHSTLHIFFLYFSWFIWSDKSWRKCVSFTNSGRRRWTVGQTMEMEVRVGDSWGQSPICLLGLFIQCCRTQFESKWKGQTATERERERERGC